MFCLFFLLGGTSPDNPSAQKKGVRPTCSSERTSGLTAVNTLQQNKCIIQAPMAPKSSGCAVQTSTKITIGSQPNVATGSRSSHARIVNVASRTLNINFPKKRGRTRKQKPHTPNKPRTQATRTQLQETILGKMCRNALGGTTQIR